MARTGARTAQNDLLYQVLETELGGIEVYTTALELVRNEDLKGEFGKYLEETRRHVELARSVLEAVGLDPEAEVPARVPVRTIGRALVNAMKAAASSGDPVAAELTACECVVLAETKDHANWELVGQLVAHGPKDLAKALAEAHAEVEKQEDHHHYHSTGWHRELWLQALGMKAVLPPPEEVKDVETAIGAARAKNAREQMLRGGGS